MSTKKALSSVSKIPYETREKLFTTVSSVLEKAKNGARADRIEKGLTRDLVRKWKQLANKAVSSALDVLSSMDGDDIVSKKQAMRMVKRIEKELSGFDSLVKKRVSSDFSDYYRSNKSDFVKRFKLKSKGKKKQLTFDDQMIKSANINKADISDSFTTLDKEALKTLVRLTAISIGDHFEADLKPAVVNALINGVFEKKLNSKNAAEFLKSELTKILGSTNQAVPPAIALSGSERVNDYFKGIVSTNMNFARNFGNVTAMEEAGIARYMIVAIMDDRTSIVCQQLNGQTFELRYAIEHIEKVNEFESVEDLKNFAPWRKDLSEVGLSANRNREEPTGQEVLAKAGMSMPPYHWLCRSEVHPV